MRSVTAVSKATNRVRNVGSWASTAANNDAYTTLSAIEPDWSTAITTSRARLGWRRPWPISRSGTITWCSGTQWRRFAPIVCGQSMSPARGRRVRADRARAPRTACVV